MKKLFYILMFLFPIVVSAQQPWYKYSPMNYGWKYVGNARFSEGNVSFIRLVFSPLDSLPYVAYADYGNSNKATVMKFDGTSWVNVGNAGFSVGETQWESLAFSPSGQPYVAYEEDSANSYKATVMTFNGTNWVNVGNAGFSAGSAFWTSLAFSPSDSEPYVAYADYTSDTSATKATVMKFDGTNWVNLGNAGFTAGEADWESLAFSPSNNQPYVAYSDYQNTWWKEKVSVMTFNGTNWVYVGNACFSAGGAGWESLAFSPMNNQPYVAYCDSANSYKATVMTFNGTNWVNVGNVGFSVGQADYESLAFSPSDGQPYVAYMDKANSGKATVMKFSGTDWVSVGNPGFTPVGAWETSLAFSRSGVPYVAYADDDYNPGDKCKATVMKDDSVYYGINELQQSKFSLYPNPATDKITVEIAEGQAPPQLSMMNLNGEEVLTLSLIKPKTQIDISNLPSGVYFVRVTNDKTVEVGKIIKE